MVAALALAFGDLADPRILGICGRSLLVSLLIFAGLSELLGWAMIGFDPCGWFGESCVLGFGGGRFGAFLLVAVGLWFLFPAVALCVISAYMDRIISAVELRHYPEAAASARPLGILRGAWLGLGSSLRVLVYHLIALPLYLVLLVTGVGPFLLFPAVNGAAFGRDLGLMVAMHHAGAQGRSAWLRATRGDRLLIGAGVTALFLVPFANLLAPVIGAAAVAHLYHRRTTSNLQSG